MQSRSNRGFTMVELLVVVAILAMIVALSLPAILAAREAARRFRCSNNLKQLATACLMHETAHGHLPTNGWGWRWVGDPDLGYDRRQPGGWIYNILPYVEEQSLRDLGRRGAKQDKRQAIRRLVTTPLAVMHCPSRRRPGLYPFTPAEGPVNCEFLPAMAKTDYACNAGDRKVDTGTGPLSTRKADIDKYQWPVLDDLNGVIHAFSMIPMSDITDGTSKTYLLGEKYVRMDEYEKGESFGGDDQTMYLGDDADIRRWTMSPPIADSSKSNTRDPFGSAHRAGCYFALCDGSVRLVPYDINATVHRYFGNRRDGADLQRDQP